MTSFYFTLNTMLKILFINFILCTLYFNSYGQIKINKVHAYKMQVIHNTDGSSKGWFSCDFYLEFNNDNNELNSVSLNSNNNSRKVIIRKKAGDKFNYASFPEVGGFEYRWYDGYDEFTAEDVKMLIGYKTSDKQLKPISVTLIYMLSSNYISLDYP